MNPKQNEPTTVNIVVVGGANYANPKKNLHEYDERAMNRIGWYLDTYPNREWTLVFHFLSVAYGVVAVSIPVPPSMTLKEYLGLDRSVVERKGAKDSKGKKSFWQNIKRTPFGPLSGDDFTKPQAGGHNFSLKRREAPPVMSILDIYDYVSTLKKKSVLELSIFSHANVYGPILGNSYQGSTVIITSAAEIFNVNYSDSLDRDPGDIDARGLKDFFTSVERHGASFFDAYRWFSSVAYEKNEDKRLADKIQTRSSIRLCAEVFHPRGFMWVWGCQGAKIIRLLVQDILASQEMKAFKRAHPSLLAPKGTPRPDKVTLAYKYDINDKTLAIGEKRLGPNNETEVDRVTGRTIKKRQSLALLVKVLISQHLFTYAAIATFVFGIPCIQSFVGTSADLEKKNKRRFPLMNVDTDHLPIADFYANFLGFHRLSKEFPYRLSVPVKK
ncbi:MAG: hypothetical protein AB1489_10285 [Acidobacteriota bacterium]